jgi:hypothetical protein
MSFDTIGMPEVSQSIPTSNGLRNTNTSNPLGDIVSNGTNDKASSEYAQGLSTNQGAYLEGQSKPSTLD